MHIALLSDPNNFHTQKWGKALVDAGAKVTVFSFDADRSGSLPSVQVTPPLAPGGKYSYFSYLQGGKRLRTALDAGGADIVNALNVTPFGVWARLAGCRPLIISALGADILEYPPKAEGSPLLDARSWANVEGSTSWWMRQKTGLSRRIFRQQVRKALHCADLVTGDNQLLVDSARDWFGVPEEKLRLLRWGVEPELFKVDEGVILGLRHRFGIAEGVRVVLSPRGAKAIYQADIIVEAFGKMLAEGCTNAHFVMLSAGYEIAGKVAEAARELDRQYVNFSFVEQVLPREEVYALWNLVDVFVSAPIYDGYSASVAEGRYIGSVPVVNDIPANREVITHGVNGWICQPFTPSQLAVDLAQVLKNFEDLRDRFQNPNRRWIEKHSLIRENALEFLLWCEKLLSGHSPVG